MTITEFINKVGFKVNDQDVNDVNKTFDKIKKNATKLLGAIGIGLSLTNMNKLIEEFGTVNNALASVVGGLDKVQEVQKTILEYANDCRASYSEMASEASNLSKANSELFPIEDAAKFTANVTKLLKSSGRDTSTIADTMKNITEMIQSGTVSSNNINNVLKKTPEAVDLIADSLGVSREKLLSMAAAGTLSAKQIKDAFLNASDSINTAFQNVDLTISDGLTNIRNKWGAWLVETDKMLGITKTVSRTMVSGFDKILSSLTKMRTGVVWLSEKVGGLENLLKLVSIVAGSIFLVLNAGKIIAFTSKLLTILKGIHIKTLALVAVLVMIGLVVDDVINFVKGNNSLLGTFLEKMGLDSEKTRDTIINAWNAVKNFLGEAFGFIKDIAVAIFGALFSFFSEHGDQISKLFRDAWTIISEAVSILWNAIKDVAVAVFGFLKAFWDKWGNTILTLFKGVWDTIKAVFDAAINIICDIFAVFADLFSGDWDKLWEDVKNLFKDIFEGIWNILSNVLNTIWTFLVDILSRIWNKIVEIFQNIWNSIVEKVTGIKDAIVNGFNKALDWIKSLPAQAVNWGKDIIQALIDGITERAERLVNKVKDVAQSIRDFLGFSEPKEGPLSDFHTYMPDMIDLMSKGIKDGKSRIKDALGDLTGDMSVMASANYVSKGTAGTAFAGYAVNKTIVQTVNINNQFNGDKAIQRDAASVMKSSADDVTSELSRALYNT